jgi:hypothetical protein
MLGLGRNRLPKRSPICKKALTWGELVKLPPETELIRYNWALDFRERVVVLSAVESSRWVDLKLLDAPFSRQFTSVGDLGAAPYVSKDGTRRWWNESNVLVLPKHADALPKGKKPGAY